MRYSPRQIAELEWANYAATQPAARITPGLDLSMREDVILTGSQMLPMPDANHASLLRTAPEHVGALMNDIIAYFQARGCAPTVYLSPACKPETLPTRLAERGFVAQNEKEAWMVMEALPHVTTPAPTPGVEVKAVGKEDATVFAKVFLRAFDMPTAFAPPMVQLLEPSIGLENTVHFLAFSGDRPIGTCSLMQHQTYGVLGSAGLVPSRRGKGAATNLAVAAIEEAQRRGITTLMLQTTANTLLERFLRIRGFQRAFTRTCYVLSDSADH